MSWSNWTTEQQARRKQINGKKRKKLKSELLIAINWTHTNEHSYSVISSISILKITWEAITHTLLNEKKNNEKWKVKREFHLNLPHENTMWNKREIGLVTIDSIQFFFFFFVRFSWCFSYFLQMDRRERVRQRQTHRNSFDRAEYFHVFLVHKLSESQQLIMHAVILHRLCLSHTRTTHSLFDQLLRHFPLCHLVFRFVLFFFLVVFSLT